MRSIKEVQVTANSLKFMNILVIHEITKTNHQDVDGKMFIKIFKKLLFFYFNM